MNARADVADAYLVEIEQAVLGALLSGRGLERVRGFLRDNHFLEDIHRRIYLAICEAHEKAGTSALNVVLPLLDGEVERALRDVSGVTPAVYLARLLRATHISADIAIGGQGLEKGARAVVDQWARHSLASELEAIAVAARDPHARTEPLLQSVGAVAEDVRQNISRAGSRRSRVTIGQAGERVLGTALKAREGGGRLTGVSWGLQDIDAMTGGMQRKDLTLIGARPSMGKTSLMTSCALAAAWKGHGIGILSLEMDAEKLTARAISDLSERGHQPVTYSDLLRGVVTDAQIENVRLLNERLAKRPIEIDEASVTTFDIRAKIEGMMERFEKAGWPRLEALMIDHLGFIQPSGHYRGNRNNEIGEITRGLKDYAKEYDIAVVLLSQLSRESARRENKRPELQDLRDSGNIEQDADFVAFLHREAYYLERTSEGEFDPVADAARIERLAACQNKLEFIIAKNRHGPVRTVHLWCDMAYSAVRNGERAGR